MPIKIDHALAREILFHESTQAETYKEIPISKQWKDWVDTLGLLCPPRKSSTFIAALGTAILAKCVASNVDVYSLLSRGPQANSYSARSLADGVWGKSRAYLGIDIGANGANPLNNTPFVGRARIDDIENVRNKAGKDHLFFCLDELAKLESEADAALALRGFLASRKSTSELIFEVGKMAGDHLITDTLASAIDAFVSRDSEEGRRAQAAAAGLLSCVFGSHNVDAGHINDPDRNYPLDITVFHDRERTQVRFSVEVKDKPVSGPELLSSAEKVLARDLQNVLFLAVSANQKQTDFRREIERSRDLGCRINVFRSWLEFTNTCLSMSETKGPSAISAAFVAVGMRLVDIGVSQRGLEEWQANALGI